MCPKKRLTLNKGKIVNLGQTHLCFVLSLGWLAVRFVEVFCINSFSVSLVFALVSNQGKLQGTLGGTKWKHRLKLKGRMAS